MLALAIVLRKSTLAIDSYRRTPDSEGQDQRSRREPNFVAALATVFRFTVSLNFFMSSSVDALAVPLSLAVLSMLSQCLSPRRLLFAATAASQKGRPFRHSLAHWSRSNLCPNLSKARVTEDKRNRPKCNRKVGAHLQQNVAQVVLLFRQSDPEPTLPLRAHMGVVSH